MSETAGKVANDLFEQALCRGSAGERLSREQAVALAGDPTPDTVHALGRAALANRHTRYGNEATYTINVHINPSNVCENQCSFCRYSVAPEAPDAYSMSEEEIFAKIEDAAPTEVHIVGGLNRDWHFKRNLALVGELRRRHPGLYIKGFTAVEIEYFARTEAMQVRDVLAALRDAGLDAMPGGGAEIFSERLRARHFQQKIDADAWLGVHRQAHALGIPTNATMLFGFGETPAERIEHLLRLRDLQDEAGGFVCFIPLAFQPGEGAAQQHSPAPIETLGVVAVSRLILDNIPHIKAYWPMIGLETTAAALSWGADDLDGTVGKERIAHAAGSTTPVALTARMMEETIVQGGFVPVERDGRFEHKKRTP